MALITSGCDGLVSFGMSGGLSPDMQQAMSSLADHPPNLPLKGRGLSNWNSASSPFPLEEEGRAAEEERPIRRALMPGALIIPEAIIDGSGLRMPTDARWRAQLSAILSRHYSVMGGDIVGVNEALTTASAKAKLYADTGAMAVDMESHRVGALATWTGVPFVAIRVISDTAERRIPPWVMAGVSADGSVATAAMICGAAMHPWDIPSLIGLAGNSSKALARLRGVVRLLGPKLGLL